MYRGEFKDTIEQFADVIQPNTPYEIKSKGHIRIDQFSVLAEDNSKAGSRLTIMSHVTAHTVDKREVTMDVAISSFIIGNDYDQQVNLIIAPTDKCILTIVGAEIPVQIIYSEFSE